MNIMGTCTMIKKSEQGPLDFIAPNLCHQLYLCLLSRQALPLVRP